MRSVINEPIKPRPLIRNYFNPRLRGQRERELFLQSDITRGLDYFALIHRPFTRAAYPLRSFIKCTWIDEMTLTFRLTESLDACIGAFEFRYAMGRIYEFYGETIGEFLRKSFEDDDWYNSASK